MNPTPVKPMVYKDAKYGSVEVLAHGVREGYQYYVISLGTHPCAYVRVHSKHPLYEKDYHDPRAIRAHGGLTYSATGINGVVKTGWWVGWDYAHYDDYMQYFANEPLGKRLHKWTTEEILEDVASAINQLKEMEK